MRANSPKQSPRTLDPTWLNKWVRRKYVEKHYGKVRSKLCQKVEIWARASAKITLIVFKSSLTRTAHSPSPTTKNSCASRSPCVIRMSSLRESKHDKYSRDGACVRAQLLHFISLNAPTTEMIWAGFRCMKRGCLQIRPFKNTLSDCSLGYVAQEYADTA